MKESILHFTWKFQLLDNKKIRTTEDEKIEVLDPGTHNHNSGPDFIDARLRIGSTLWAGNIEIHSKASDWFAHKHDIDPAYKNVILHVVFKNDLSSAKSAALNIPVLELQNFISQNLLEQYDHLMKSRLWIACLDSIHLADEMTRISWQNRLVVERLQKRYNTIIQLVEKNKNDWLESFYQFLARNFGFNINSDAFEMLAESIPLKLFSKHKHNHFQIEALLFGQSGILSQDMKDDYPKTLFTEYVFLKKKYGLNDLSNNIWKLAKLRPTNFPTIRISQFADLLSKSSKLFSMILETKDLKEIYKFFNIEASDYWNDHYLFDKLTEKKSKKKIGKKSIENIIINTIVPYLFVYGKERDLHSIKERAIVFLEKLPPENNSILVRWQELGFRNKNSADSQALLHLKKHYCDKKLCLQCGIGTKILRKQ